MLFYILLDNCCPSTLLADSWVLTRGRHAQEAAPRPSCLRHWMPQSACSWYFSNFAFARSSPTNSTAFPSFFHSYNTSTLRAQLRKIYRFRSPVATLSLHRLRIHLPHKIRTMVASMNAADAAAAASIAEVSADSSSIPLPAAGEIPATFMQSVRSWWSVGEKNSAAAEERLLR